MHDPVVRSDRLTARPFPVTDRGCASEGRSYESGNPAGIAGTTPCVRLPLATGPVHHTAVWARHRSDRVPRPVLTRGPGRGSRLGRHPAGSGGRDQTSGIGRFVERLRSTLGPNARQSLAALGLNSATSFVAGGVLGSITATFARVPGLLVLVPAAIGLRGNIFGAFGNRISTSIHAGTFRLSLRRETVLGQNVLAAGVLTVGLSVGIAVVAKVVAVALGIEGTVGVLDLAVISIVGGVLGVDRRDGGHPPADRRRGAQGLGPRQRHRPDRERAGRRADPAGAVAGRRPRRDPPGHQQPRHRAARSPSIALVVVAARSRLEDLRRIVRESLPILLAAATLSTWPVSPWRSGSRVRPVPGPAGAGARRT